jgi:iron complex outermembrane receptor protein
MPRCDIVTAAARTILAIVALSTAQGPISAQAPDSTRKRDTLPELEVRVTRAPEASTRLPMAVGVLGGTTIRRAQLTTGIDESLSRLPGVVVLNRYNYSLDQRVSLRGAGSRANFGLRGVKVLLDGVPQTLPDGQSQLTNLELGIIDRVEVLTGSAGALYGNASGGVLAFSTGHPRGPLASRLRLTGGSFDTFKWNSVLEGGAGSVSGLISLSSLKTDGFRQHSRAEAYQGFGKLDFVLDERSSLGLRVSFADAPHAENPGALTAAEYAATRDSAAGTNILRGADKDVSQQQLSLRYRWLDGTGTEVEATVFGLLRDLANPLATPPPAPAPTTAGTYNTIDRRAAGVRLAGTMPLVRGDAPLRMTLGADLQTMRDDRRNERSDGGAPTGIVLADQRETVSEVGPFTQLHWSVSPTVLLLGAARFDRLSFRVRDRFLTDGVDNSGRRILESVSGFVGASVLVAEGTTLFANTATSFESPTTTELVNQSNGTAGFNSTLGPQRTWSVELGARGNTGTGFQYSLSLFSNRITDAIIQVREQDGRAFFQNAGRVRNRGVEAGLGAQPWPWLRLQGAYNFADYEFTEYRIPNGATTDTLDGNRLAGVPRHFFRASAAATFGPLTVEADQTTAGEMFGDDRNTQRVAGWGAGVTSLRASAEFVWGQARFEPFAAINNLFDRRYVGSVNINGAFGRVLEPAPGRNGYLGMEVSWSKR